MEAVFAKDTGELFSCVCSVAAPGKSFYCPSTPHTLNTNKSTNNKVAVLTPSNSILQSGSLISVQTPKQHVSLSLPLSLLRPTAHIPTHPRPPTFLCICTMRVGPPAAPPTIPQAPPTANSQSGCCDKDVTVERPLVFEKEEERRPSLACGEVQDSCSNQEENCILFNYMCTSLHFTTSDITPSTPHTNNVHTNFIVH